MGGALNQAAHDQVLLGDATSVGMVGDDNRWRTSGWDVIFDTWLTEHIGIAYGDDGFQHERLATSWWLSRAIVDEFGMAHPKLRHLWMDSYWMSMGHGARCIRYFPDVKIEHLHPSTGKAATDAIYARGSSDSNIRHDEGFFAAWSLTDRARDVSRLREIVGYQPEPTDRGSHDAIMGTPPAVSVIIPCYQQAEYLGAAVESVVAQTFSDWEIVIVDDGSRDATAAVAEKLIVDHPDRRIRLVRQPNEGLPEARNSGIAASVGRYILPLDADDLLMPEMLARTVGLLESDPTVAVAYTDQLQFGAASRIVRTEDWDTDVQRRRNLFPATALFRREVWTAVGGYNPNMRDGYEDWDFWISVAERGFTGRRIPELLLGYRIQENSRSVRARERHRELVAQIHANHPDWYRDPWRRWRRWPGRAWRRLRWEVQQARWNVSRRARE
jgi:glycosyltransferase involved in cell wall biosynthesis